MGIVNHDPLSGFVKRWNEETCRYHFSVEEMTLTLGNVSCLLHLPIEGRLLDLDGPISSPEAVEPIVDLLGMNLRMLSSRCLP
jgi:hypothetical protein